MGVYEPLQVPAFNYSAMETMGFTAVYSAYLMEIIHKTEWVFELGPTDT